MSLADSQSGGSQSRQARANDHNVHDILVSSGLSGVRMTQLPSGWAHAPGASGRRTTRWWRVYG
ncbi:hypothetical protein FM101_14675 [Arthrobacter rhombi]|uniref:Uncharacterized protein n=1 Tax=Arthrobacter rhombi TaxID=71253 RepID=A0A1R4GVV8_9MICC|nr:hypothetical protein FM101_14675 [Arthrobacter rhombi]